MHKDIFTKINRIGKHAKFSQLMEFFNDKEYSVLF